MAERLLGIMDQYSPNFRRAVADYVLFTPYDLGQRVLLTDGNIHHVDISPSQMLWQRPLPELAHYRAPLQNLYLCGAGMHGIAQRLPTQYHMLRSIRVRAVNGLPAVASRRWVSDMRIGGPCLTRPVLLPSQLGAAAGGHQSNHRPYMYFAGQEHHGHDYRDTRSGQRVEEQQ